MTSEIELHQGTQEWKLARCGSLGASRVADAIATTRTGWGASRDNLMAELIAERLTGIPVESYINAAMTWGTTVEPQARAAYEFARNIEVKEVGIIKHPKLVGTHASPDGLVGDDGLLEIKAPNTSTHLDTLLGGSIIGKYITQMQWQLACSGRKWVDFVSFDPRLPARMQLHITQVQRDNKRILELEKIVAEFLNELDDKITSLRMLYPTSNSEAA